MNSGQLLLHNATRSQIDTFTASPGSALLLTGQAGSGKKTVAKYLAATLLGSEVDRLDKQSHFLLINKPEAKTEIPIESIRQLINKVSLKAPTAAGRPINRVVLIQDAQHLSIEAQNALLKLLEEPPAGTLLVLTAANEDDLLPTVVSRVQKIYISQPSLVDSINFFDTHPKSAVDSAWRLSQGGAGLLSAILSQEATHPLKIAVEQAKSFISQKTYQRLISLQKISKNKAELITFLDGLAKVLGVLHAQSLASNRPNSSKILLSRQAVEQAIKSVQNNTNTRLVSLQLALNIPL